MSQPSDDRELIYKHSELQPGEVGVFLYVRISDGVREEIAKGIRPETGDCRTVQVVVPEIWVKVLAVRTSPPPGAKP